MTGNVLEQAAGANTAFTSGFASGGTFNSISQSSPFFVPPALFNSASNIHAAQYQEWNLQLQQGFGDKTSVSINYVGNHQIYGPIQNGGLNAYCNVAPITPPNPSVPAATPCAADLLNAVGFVGLPVTPPDPRFGTITEISSSNAGNYNGVTLSLQRRFSSLQFQANYTYSHALTMISNGASCRSTSTPTKARRIRTIRTTSANITMAMLITTSATARA